MVEVDSGQIWVSRRNFTQDIAHKYLVYIDGIPVGELSTYRTGRYEVPPGFHRVWARRAPSNPVALGDVVIKVQSGEVRRVKTTSRTRRLPFGQLLLALIKTIGDHSGTGFAVEFSPAILLRATPPSDSDANPPPDIGLNTSSEI